MSRPAEANALLADRMDCWAWRTYGNRLPPAALGICQPVALSTSFFADFSPTTDFPGGTLVLLSSRWIFFFLRSAMHIHAAQPLFAWGALDDCPTLVSLREFLAAVPDQALLDGLHQARGHGRDDYPVRLL